MIETKVETLGNGDYHISLWENEMKTGYYTFDSEMNMKEKSGKYFMLGCDRIQDVNPETLSIIVTDDKNLVKDWDGSLSGTALVLLDTIHQENAITYSYSQLKALNNVDVMIDNDNISKNVCLRFSPISRTVNANGEFEIFKPKNIIVSEDIDINHEPEKIYFNDKQLDKLFGGLQMGDVEILSGMASSGKSTFATHILARLIERGYPVWNLSCEMSAQNVFMTMYKNLLGFKHVSKYTCEYTGIEKSRIKKEMIPVVKEYLRDKYFVLDPVATNDRTVVEHMKESFMKFGCKVFVIDNLFSLNLSCYSNNPNEAQTLLMNDLNIFAKQYGVYVLLLAHPRKFGTNEGKDNTIRKFDLNCISGSGNLVNSASKLIVLARPTDDDKEEYFEKAENFGKDISVGAILLKDRHDGRNGTVEWFKFSHSTGRFGEPNANIQQLTETFNKNIFQG